MAFKNAMDQVTIDESAANIDIQKIRNAIAKLEDSKNSLEQLQKTASLMKGQTGSAIVDQCARLTSEVKNLTYQLNGSIRFIQNTVAKYREDDRIVGQKIRMGGGN